MHRGPSLNNRSNGVSRFSNLPSRARVRIDVTSLRSGGGGGGGDDSDEDDARPATELVPPSLNSTTTTTTPATLLPPEPQIVVTIPATTTTEHTTPASIPQFALRIGAYVLLFWILGITLVMIMHTRSPALPVVARDGTFVATFMVEQNGQSYAFNVDLPSRARHYELCCTDAEGALRCGVDVRHIGIHIQETRAVITVHFPPRVYLSKCTLFCTRSLFGGGGGGSGR